MAYILICNSENVDNNIEELIKRVTLGALIGTMGATIRAFLAKNETLWTKVKIFFAGVFFALLCSMILVNSAIPTMYQNMICGAAGSFVSTLWPLVEKGVVSFTAIFIKKKTKDIEDVVSNDRNKHNRGNDRPNDPTQYP